MNADELRALQTPLKNRYRENPDSARDTLHARGALRKGIECRIEAGACQVTAGLHPKTGGDGKGACSGDMLLEALVACAGVTLQAVATSMGIEIRAGKVLAEGDLDFRGTLGVSKDVPVGFSRIRLRFELDTDADPGKLETLLKLTERYCVVFQTLRQPPAIESSITAAK